MNEFRFLKLGAVMVLHDRSLREYGGVPGVKDQGLLESALGRPLNKAAYADEGELDVFELAAAYAYGVARNHAFNDANKRTAWACCVLFLKRNGVALQSQAADNVAQMLPSPKAPSPNRPSPPGSEPSPPLHRSEQP